MDAAATAGGNQDPHKQGLRSILIHKSHMYTEASLDPERCSYKSDQKAKSMWVANQIRKLGHYEDAIRPNIHTQEEYMEEEINMAEHVKVIHRRRRQSYHQAAAGYNPHEPK